jgi:hypothetical protein
MRRHPEQTEAMDPEDAIFQAALKRFVAGPPLFPAINSSRLSPLTRLLVASKDTSVSERRQWLGMLRTRAG